MKVAQCKAPVPGGCPRKAYLTGLCSGHYQRARLDRPIDTPLKTRRPQPGPAPKQTPPRPRIPGRCDRCGCRLREENKGNLCWPCGHAPEGKTAPTDRDLVQAAQARRAPLETES